MAGEHSDGVSLCILPVEGACQPRAGLVDVPGLGGQVLPEVLGYAAMVVPVSVSPLTPRRPSPFRAFPAQ